MTGVVSDGALNPGDVMRRLADLERDLAQMRAERRLTLSSALLRGNLTVVDNQDDPRLIIGLLPSGRYGLAAVDENGGTVELASLAFGLRAQTIPNSGATTSEEFGDLDGAVPVGPTLEDVLIGPTGRCVVTLSSRLSGTVDVNLAIEYMGFEVTGATDLEPFQSDAIIAHSESTFAALTLTKVFVIDGLNPGLHTFTAKYASGTGQEARFSSRTLIVQPF